MSEREAIIKVITDVLADPLFDVASPFGKASVVYDRLFIAGFVIVKREAEKHQIDAAYAQCGMDGPDLALMYRVMVQAAQEQK
jgi:hypothetical protein